MPPSLGLLSLIIGLPVALVPFEIAYILSYFSLKPKYNASRKILFMLSVVTGVFAFLLLSPILSIFIFDSINVLFLIVFAVISSIVGFVSAGWKQDLKKLMAAFIVIFVLFPLMVAMGSLL